MKKSKLNSGICLALFAVSTLSSAAPNPVSQEWVRKEIARQRP